MPSTDSKAGPALRPVGLRERKKAQTRAEIQRHALRLFRDHGYAATTMEQIAAAADVSPSTLYRYFPTKEDLILSDDYDPMMAAAFRAQPRDLPPLVAFRAAVNEVLDAIPEEDRAAARERFHMSFDVPEVRARFMDHLIETSDLIRALFAERVGGQADDFGVRILVGTVVGAMIAAQQYAHDHPESDLFAVMDEALARLIAGTADLGKQ